MNYPKVKVLGLDISYIRDTMSCMKPEYQHLSPAIGAALCNSVVLPNLFSAVGGVQKYNTSITYPSNTYSPIQNAILAREMFFQPTSYDTVRATESRGLPAYWLNPFRIGWLVGLLHERSPLDKYSALVKEWSDASGGSKEGIGQLKIMKFVDLIHAAMRECHDPISSIPKDSATTVFPTGFTIQLFLALLWSKVSVKRDLRDFYAGLKKVIPNPTNQKLDSSRWDTSSYAPDNKKCVNLSLDIEKWYSEAKHFQRAVYYISYTQSQNYGLPIALSYHSRSHATSRGSVNVSDCMEATIRNFVTLIAFDPSTGKCDLSGLPSPLKPIDALVGFFKSFNAPLSFDLHRLATAGQSWFNMMQGIPTASYLCSGEYELQPSFSNFTSVLNHLFQLKCKNLEEFLSVISTPNKKYLILESTSGSHGRYQIQVSSVYFNFSFAIQMASNHATYTVLTQSLKHYDTQALAAWAQLQNWLNASSPKSTTSNRITILFALSALLFCSLTKPPTWKQSWVTLLLLKPNPHISMKTAFALIVPKSANDHKLSTLAIDAIDSKDYRMLNLVRNLLRDSDEYSRTFAHWIKDNWSTFGPSGHYGDMLCFCTHPLHTAVRYNQLEVCKQLVQHGHSPKELNSEGFKPVHYATDERIRIFLQPLS